MKQKIEQTAWEIGMPSKKVTAVYKLFWKYVYNAIISIDRNNSDTYKRASFNLPALGKLVFNENKLNIIKKKLNGKDNRKCTDVA